MSTSTGPTMLAQIDTELQAIALKLQVGSGVANISALVATLLANVAVSDAVIDTLAAQVVTTDAVADTLTTNVATTTTEVTALQDATDSGTGVGLKATIPSGDTLTAFMVAAIALETGG